MVGIPRSEPRVAQAHSVPSVCPIVRRLRATHDLMRYLRLARSSNLTQWIRQIKLVPKLTVRVRSPSPAPNTKSVAAVGDSLSLLLHCPSVRPTPEHRWTINGPSVGHMRPCPTGPPATWS